VLGYPWLREANPQIRFATGTFRWWPKGAPGRIQIMDAEDLLRNIAPGEKAYVLHPGGLSCTSIPDRVKDILMSAEQQGDAPASPQGTGPSGDVEKNIRWYNQQGLGWLKQWVDNIESHLKRCVGNHPELQAVPSEAKRHTVATVFNQAPRRATGAPAGDQ
jgi:hypothetical protein